jgi:signal peptidase I
MPEKSSTGHEKLEKSENSKAIKEYIQVIAIAFVLVFGFIRPFVVEAFKIPSGSMKDTLLVGDRILVCKFIYGIRLPLTNHRILDFNKPQRGDTFVFVPPHDPSRNFIKRIVALEGDVVETRGASLYVNGKLVDDSGYAIHKADLVREDDFSPDYPEPYTVPPGRVFAMGDNREESSDSRRWGSVPLENIKGRAFLIYWSKDGKPWEINKIRLNRMGKIIHSQFSSQP